MIKALRLRKALELKMAERAALNETLSELDKREAEITEALEELTPESSAEDRAVVEESADKFEADKAEADAKREALDKEIEDIEGELAEVEADQDKAETKEEEREDSIEMDKRNFTEQEMKERKAFGAYIRSLITGKQERDTDYNLIQGNNGVIVPKTIATEVITKVRDICPIFEKAHRYNVKGDLEIPYYPYSADHGISVAYKDEMDELVASSGDFGVIELKGFLAGALAKISKKLIKNTDVDIIPFITDQMAEGFRVFYEHECLIGTNQKATGLIAGIDNGAFVTGAYKSSVSSDELIEVQDKVKDAFQKNACWIMSEATRTAIRKLKDSNGDYLLNKDLTTAFGYQLLGKPVYVSDNMPELGAANNVAIIYGDLSGLGVKVTEDMEIETLLEKFATQHAVGILGWTEVDTKVENAQKFSAFKCGSSDPQ